MAKLTVLDIVQNTLSAMDSDEVNSISDTTESLQVANIVRRCFYDLASDLDLPEHETLFELDASLDEELPCVMYIPEHVKRVDWLKYNIKNDEDTYSNYRTIKYMGLVQFQEMMNAFKNEASDILEMEVPSNSETFEFICRTNLPPTYYTSVNDTTLIFDSYDLTADTTLQKSKTMCKGVILPSFTLSDSFIPNLSTQQFSLLSNAVVERAFVELKQAENVNASRETRRQRVINQYQKRRSEGVEEIYKVPRYGRK